jgi:hypothetical protein
MAPHRYLTAPGLIGKLRRSRATGASIGYMRNKLDVGLAAHPGPDEGSDPEHQRPADTGGFTRGTFRQPGRVT